MLTVLGVVATFSLTACSQAKAYSSQCVYIIQSGYLDVRHIQKILHPGERASTTNSQAKYIYCNARNYLVRPDGDRKEPLTGRTEQNQDGTPGNPVKVFLSMYWQVNQNDNVLRRFLPFCEKYNCFSGSDTSGSARYSSQGWLGMLHETFDPALERATVKALLNYHGNLPTDQAVWPKLAQDISANFMEQVKLSDGSDDQDFFCSSGSPHKGDDLHSGYDCQPVQLQVDTVEYANPQAEALFQQSTTLDAQKALADKQAAVNKAQRNALAQKYGRYTDYFIGLQETLDHCNANTHCTVIIGGNGSNVNVNAGG
jgi:hypothetical protein